MAIRKLKAGKWQVDYTDERRSIARTRRNFDTRREADEYEAALKTQAQDNLLGRRKRRLFGEALTRYLDEVSPGKKDHAQTVRLVAALRWPIRAEGRWITLEHVPLEAPPGQLSIATAMNHWRADMKAIVKRVYLDNRIWHLRRMSDGKQIWHEQPPALDSNIPAHRIPITDPARIAQLDETAGRGAYQAQTLRTRQAVVRSVLKCAWRDWDWMSADLRGKIALESTKGTARQVYATSEELSRLIEAARQTQGGEHFAHAIHAAALIGWRQANLLNLEWGHVVFPVYDDTGRELQCGYITAPADEVKTGVPLAQPLSTELADLLKQRWNLRHGRMVFHRGDGQPFRYFRRIWETAKKQAGIDKSFRWHDLRHTWASRLVQSGATDRQLQELGGWTSPAMVRTYAHLRIEHLRDVVELGRSK